MNKHTSILFLFFLFFTSNTMENKVSKFIFKEIDHHESIDDCLDLALRTCQRIYGDTASNIKQTVQLRFEKIRKQLQSTNLNYRFYKIFDKETLAGYFSFFLEKPTKNDCNIEILNMDNGYNPELSKQAIKFLIKTYHPKHFYIIARKHRKNDALIKTLLFEKCKYKPPGYEAKERQGYKRKV